MTNNFDSIRFDFATLCREAKFNELSSAPKAAAARWILAAKKAPNEAKRQRCLKIAAKLRKRQRRRSR